MHGDAYGHHLCPAVLLVLSVALGIHLRSVLYLCVCVCVCAASSDTEEVSVHQVSLL